MRDNTKLTELLSSTLTFMVGILVILTILFSGIKLGENKTQNDIEHRVLLLDDKTFEENKDLIEYIVFGESQL